MFFSRIGYITLVGSRLLLNADQIIYETSFTDLYNHMLNTVSFSNFQASLYCNVNYCLRAQSVCERFISRLSSYYVIFINIKCFLDINISFQQQNMSKALTEKSQNTMSTTFQILRSLTVIQINVTGNKNIETILNSPDSSKL